MADRMFGLIAAGRHPEMFKQVGEVEFAAELPAADTVNHLVVFLSGAVPFPEGYGASVYICWQINGESSSWNYLGAICNTKPSAIFKISQTSRGDGQSSALFGTTVYSGTQGTAQVGLKVEPLHVLESLQAESTSKATSQTTLAEFGEKMVQNLVNHAESYAVRLPRPDGTGCGDYIPVHALHEWVTTFTRRFKQNPFFWKNLQNG